MDFKWTLSRPGISLEFETGSVKEAIGLLEEEGTQIQEIFGLTMGSVGVADAAAIVTGTAAGEPAKGRGRPRKPAPEAVAPEPLPVPAQEVAPPLAPLPPSTPLPPNALDTGIPAFLDRTAPAAPAAPPLPLPTPTPPPVGTLGPKIVEALNAKAAASPDGGQAFADWLAGCGLTIKGAKYADACRAVLMISDEKLGPAAAILGVS